MTAKEIWEKLQNGEVIHVTHYQRKTEYRFPRTNSQLSSTQFEKVRSRLDGKIVSNSCTRWEYKLNKPD